MEPRSIFPLFHTISVINGVFISLVDAPATLAPPIELVKPIDQDDFTISLTLPNPTVVLVQKEGDDNAKAVEMIKRLANTYLIEPQIRFKSYTFTSEPMIDELRNVSFSKLPTFVILFRNEVAIFRYVVDEYEDKLVLSEDAVIDFINDYANTDVTIRGSHYTLPGRIPDVDKMVKKATAFDAPTLNAIEAKVKESDRAYQSSKEKYLKVISLLREEGMESVWKQLSDQRKLIRKVEAEEECEDDNDTESDVDDDTEEDDDLEDLEDLITFRNILRSFARDIPVGPFKSTFDEEELYFCLLNIHKELCSYSGSFPNFFCIYFLLPFEPSNLQFVSHCV